MKKLIMSTKSPIFLLGLGLLLFPQGLINFEKGKLNATVIWTRIDLGKSLNNVLS